MAPEGPRHRDGVPELRALPAHDRAREHGLPAEAGRGRRRRRSTARCRRRRKILDLTEHLDRKPANLSGGQRQRVAMGRAIVRDPKAFLMDEPLSNLDAKLRVQMRTEVSRIQSRLGTTTVYVTHDQTEAMTLGDRVAVMRGGVLQQVGSPAELYDHPVNLFVAGFIGSPSMNFMPAKLDGDNAHLPMGDVRLPRRRASALQRPSRASRSSPASGRRASRTRRSSPRTPATAVRRSRPRSTSSSRWAPRSTRYFQVEESPVESEELRELAEDAGTAEVPGATEGQVVARLEPASRGRARERGRALARLAQAALLRPGERPHPGAASDALPQLLAEAVDHRVLIPGRPAQRVADR